MIFTTNKIRRKKNSVNLFLEQRFHNLVIKINYQLSINSFEVSKKSNIERKLTFFFSEIINKATKKKTNNKMQWVNTQTKKKLHRFNSHVARGKVRVTRCWDAITFDLWICQGACSLWFAHDLCCKMRIVSIYQRVIIIKSSSCHCAALVRTICQTKRSTGWWWCIKCKINEFMCDSAHRRFMKWPLHVLQPLN